MYIHMVLTPGWELLSKTGLFCVTLRTEGEFPWSYSLKISVTGCQFIPNDFSFTLTLIFQLMVWEKIINSITPSATRLQNYWKHLQENWLSCSQKNFSQSMSPRCMFWILRWVDGPELKSLCVRLKVLFLCNYDQLASSCWKYSH